MINSYPQVVHTFTILAFVLGALLFAPHAAHAAILWDQYSTASTDNVNVSNDQYIDNATFSGTVQYIGIVGKRWTGASDLSTSFQLADSSGSYIDCQTGTDTLSGFGFPASSGFLTTADMELVYIGPFSGTQCNQSYSGVSGPIFKSVSNVSSSGAWQTGLHEESPSNFIAQIVILDGPPTPDGSCVDGDFGSCINTVDPANGAEIATSSLPYLFEVDGYISAEDYETGARIMIKIDRNTDQQAQGALIAWDSAFGNKTYLPLSSSGSFDVSTSTTAISENLNFPMDRIGLYRARWEIQTPKYSIFGFAFNYTAVQSLNTRFTVGTSTPLDLIQIDQEEYLQGVIDSISGDPLEQCNFNFFDSAFDFRLGSELLGCIGGMLHWLLVLPPGVLENTIVQLKEGFLTRVPWGYFTRIVNAVQDGSAGTLPTVHADIPIGGGDNISIEFDIDDIISGAASTTDLMVSPDGDTLRDIAEPILQLIVGLLVLMFIWKDIMRSV